MGSLFASLGTASSALSVLERAIGFVQNNVTNATTPGYVTQTLQLGARPFDATHNLWGGVEATGVQSARDSYAEQSVRSASQRAGLNTQQAASLNSLQQIFDISGSSGVPSALSGLYTAFSAWSSNPTDAAARQSVLTAAQGLTTSFAHTYAQAQQVSANTDNQLAASVTKLNQYSAEVANLNGQIRTGSGNDAGLQAQLYTTLEQMSNVAPVDVHIESDGTATVLLGGQSPLVLGATANAVALKYTQPAVPTYPGAAPSAQLLSADGQDVTSMVTEGTLGGALTFRNSTIPSIIGDASQQGSLNVLAKGVADRVNTLLTNGEISAAQPGPPVVPAVPGVPLFNYSAATPTAIAGSLSLVPTTTAAKLAAIDTATGVANGVASQLAGLVNSQAPADLLNGFNYTQFYGNIAGGVGQQAANATANSTTSTSILNQAQTLRAQVSGVSLNDQATQLLQFQQAYQASAQMISVVNTLAQSLITLMQKF